MRAVGASAGGHLVALLGATNGISTFEGEGGNARFSSLVQSVVDIDGPVTFIDPGNIEKEKKGPYDTNTRLVGGTYDAKPDLWRDASRQTSGFWSYLPPIKRVFVSYGPFFSFSMFPGSMNVTGPSMSTTDCTVL